jgi:hypothetical protein
MTIRFLRRQNLSRASTVATLFALAAGVSGCAQVGDTLSPAFADPAKYDLYDCKQLEVERKTLTGRAAELEKLMTKAQTGVGGTVVAEVAYRQDLVSIHSQQKLAEEAWRRYKCRETPPETPAAAAPAAPAASAKGAKPSRSGARQ